MFFGGGQIKLDGSRGKSIRVKLFANPLICIVEIAALLVLCWIQLDMSTQWKTDCFSFFSTMPPEFMLLSVFTLAALFCVVYAVVGNLTASGVIMALFCTILAIVNYFVVAFHGSPVSFLEIKNAATAANMMGTYQITMTPVVAGILAIGVAELALALFGLRFAQKHKAFGGRSWQRSLGLVAASLMIAFVGYLSPAPVKPAHVLIWNWTTAYPYYGFVPCTVDTLQTCFHLVEEPEGYSDEALAQVKLPERTPQTATPDIVLILNETFYDLHQVSNFATEVDYLGLFRSLEGALRGYAVVPSIGGGTNKSEYELLTGNSMAPLAQSGAPFFTVDMTDAASLVTLLAQQGYETTAAHPRDAVNYSRNSAYPAMGFDHVYFRDDFEDLAFTRGRWYETDESTYANVIRWYEENLATNEAAGIERPQFMYCLTIQNHGDWTSSDESYDTVHAIGNFGMHGSVVDEYLTGIKESDEAFAMLVKYFQESSRPTIVCMVGDHAPSFAADIADTETHSEEELELLLRSTPFIIWANYDSSETWLEQADMPVGEFASKYASNVEPADAPDEVNAVVRGPIGGYISMNNLACLLAHRAGVGVSQYFAYLFELMRSYPVLTAYGVYYDTEGNRYSYDADCDPAVLGYRYLDYANIMHLGDRAVFAYADKD